MFPQFSQTRHHQHQASPGFQGSPQATQVVQGRQGRRVAFTQQSHAALQDLQTKLPRSTTARCFLMFLTFFHYCYAVEAVQEARIGL